MIVNNKESGVRIFPYNKGNTRESFFLFPGVNGNVPEGVGEHPDFKEQVEVGLLEIIETKKDVKIDPARENMKPDMVAKIADLDVVETILGMKEAAAAALINDIVKEPTLQLLKNKEVRGPVLAAIEKQFENIAKVNAPKKI